jgi:hypothetical protein
MLRASTRRGWPDRRAPIWSVVPFGADRFCCASMDLVAVIRHNVHAEAFRSERSLGSSASLATRFDDTRHAKRVPIDRSSLPIRSMPARDAMHSGRDFAMLCAQQDTTWFLAAHVAAFTHFAGVIAAVANDNLTAAVGKVLVGARRVLRPRFAALAAHYAFEPRFCRPGERHDKGRVERRGGHIRQHLAPLPQGGSLAEMSTALQKTPRCTARPGRVASRLVGTRAIGAAGSPAAVRRTCRRACFNASDLSASSRASRPRRA